MAAIAAVGLTLVGAASPDATLVPTRIIVVDSAGEAERIHARLESGADFGALAGEKSLDPSAAHGGSLGLVDPSGLRGELQKTLKELRPGQISAVVKIPTGYAILQRVAAPEPPAAAMDPGEGPPAGLPQFGGMRYPANTAGTFDVEALFRAMPKLAGWNSETNRLCELHSATPIVATQRLSEFLSDPATVAKMAPKDLWQAYYMWAVIESYQGHLAQAIEQWENAYRVGLAHLPEIVPTLEEALGSAHLHKAEMDNGIYLHADDRCLFPPRPGAARPRLEKRADAEKARDYFTKYLKTKPDDVGVKWLLNLTHFLLGDYPQGVPQEHLVAPTLFDSKRPAGRFVDVANEAGLGGEAYISGGMLVDDFDNDGLLDIVTGSYDVCEHFRFFRNRGDGTFEERAAASGLAKVAGGQGLTQTDYDNDGCLDILVTRGAWQVPMPLSLVRNNCDGTFTEVTREAGLGDQLYASQLGVWTDFDNDGWLDLFVGNEQGPSQLFRNRHDGTFANVSAAAGIDRTSSLVKGAVSEDYDNDGDADLFVSNIRGGGNLLHRNNGDGTFTEVARSAGVDESRASFATWFFDYDNDGWSDLFVASDYGAVEESLRSYLSLPRLAPPPKLYRNTGTGTFEDASAAVGLDRVLIPMGASYGDIDNDGYLDMYLGTGAPDYGSLAPNVLLRNEAGKAFEDVTTSTGTGELHKTHGIVFADLANDGQQHIVTSVGGAVPSDAHAMRLFRNPGNDNDWIALKLVGVQTNRAAFGAHLKLTVQNGNGRPRAIHRTVGNGGSFGTSPLLQSIGLGADARIVELEVSWPTSRTRQTFQNVATRQFLEIREQAATYTRLERRAFALAGPARSERHPAVGVVLEIDRPGRRLVVSHQDIPGLMDAMVMPFTVVDPKELDGVAPNSMIDFTVVVEGDKSYVEGIRAHESKGPEAQPLQAQRMDLIERLMGTEPALKPLEVGQPVPDFSLVDQRGRPVAFSELAGKVVAVSFMYTKCRLPNFCFRLSNNFGVLQKRFADRLGKDLVLLTITFDPLHDTPEVLAQYAKTWKADAAGWHMLTGPEDDVRRVCRRFGMNFWPDMGMISHTLQTVLVDRRGRLAARLEGNEFTAQQLGDLVQAVMNRPADERAAF